MYEHVTYEGIMQRMLERIPDTVDKREGSIVYDALASAAVELQMAYIELDVILNETFADTASRDYLIRRASERNITPFPATKAIMKGEFTPITLDIPIGSRFSCGKLNYVVTEKIADGQYKMQCESAGEEGNAQSGQMIPIQYIDGLQTCSLTDILIPGENEEDTEVFRHRYIDSFDSQAFGGNVADYKEKTKAIDGVGGVKVYPVWNGGGTVKLVIIGSDFSAPSQILIDNVQTAIDPIQNQGVGAGLAPIGHTVTVVGCSESPVDVGMNITFQEGWNWDSMKMSIEGVIDDYFKELSSDWESLDNVVVRVSQIETRILNLTGVLDIADVTLNGSGQNLFIDANSIPIKGGVTHV